MTSNLKPSAVSSPEAQRGGNFYHLAIVGAGSLKGKEVAEVLGDRNFPSADVKLLDDDETLGQLESLGDEVTFIQNVRSEQFENIDFTFFASDQECTRKNWKTARKAGSALVDLSYALEDEADAVRTRNGWFWSGDLGYRDENGTFYFAGRGDDWLRVDGENFAAAPVEATNRSEIKRS